MDIVDSLFLLEIADIDEEALLLEDGLSTFIFIEVSNSIGKSEENIISPFSATSYVPSTWDGCICL